MNSLVGYGSDDNSEESVDEKVPEVPGHSSGSRGHRKAASHEDNYEEVGMDMSEDSNDSRSSHRGDSKFDQRLNKTSHSSGSGLNTSERRSASGSPKYRRGFDERRNGREDRYRNDDKNRRRDERDDDRRRDEDRPRDRYKDERKDKRGDRYNNRDRRERRRSRDRKRSRSPRKPERKSKSPKRSRSRSRSSRGFPSRREKADKRMDRLDKLGIEFKPDTYPASALEEAERNLNSDSSGNKFFMPGITGRFRDQIEKRKLLWQKAKEPDNITISKPVVSGVVPSASSSKATKVYEATTFADDKTSNKFKRLMGIKETDSASLPVKGTDVLKKQQEMFSSMEAQYEVARTATHTMRGVGLGFGSFQR